MTAAEGLQLAAIGAAGIFVVGIVSMLLWRLEARQARRRRAPRFEAPRRMALMVEDLTEDEPTTDLTPDVCPYCNRNAGHDDGCYARRVQQRAEQIQIPREGETR